MIEHIRAHGQLFAIIIMWVVVTLYGGILIYAVLPISVLMMRARDQYVHIFFGFLMILILSDLDPMFVAMRKIKTAKHAMMVAVSLVVLMDRQKMSPLSAVFAVFLPFFAYSILPLANGNDPITGAEKTLSYALLFLAVPNYVLYNFRRDGWEFVRNLVYFTIVILLFSYAMLYVRPNWVSAAGRFRALFGNPNGMGIFSFLMFMLVTVASYMKKDLFTFRTKMLIYGVLVYTLIECGSRTAVAATAMFLVFSRFFGFSPFIGVIAFILFLAVAEAVQTNLSSIVLSLGLEKFFRIETLDDGSGRYFAWGFAWQQINDGGYFLFGGGFGNDEYVMRLNYPYLRSQGHHGGVHNSYLTMWFNTGIIGIIIFLRSFFLIFLKSSKRVPMAFAVMFASMFSALYESWLTGSLNPFTIILVTIMTLVTEPDIVNTMGTTEDEADTNTGTKLEPEVPVPIGIERT